MKQTLISLIILTILTANQLNGICQEETTVKYKDYIISYERIEFNFEDSIYPFTVFIEPNGYFYFQKGYFEKENVTETTYRSIDRKSPILDHKDKFVEKSNEILNIESYYPQLLQHDSSVINHYPIEPKITSPSYELEYSYINYNLREPNLYTLNETEIIRLIAPEEYSGVQRDYSAIRLDLKANKLFYSKGIFSKNSEYKLLETDSCILKEKHMDEIKEIIYQIDFENEYYFTELGIEFYPKFLIEYKTGDRYYVLERHLSNNRKDIYPELYFKLFYLRKNYIKQK